MSNTAQKNRRKGHPFDCPTAKESFVPSNFGKNLVRKVKKSIMISSSNTDKQKVKT